MKEWSESQQIAFDKIKEALCHAPVLASPRFGEAFIVETDASSWALAACLLQHNSDNVKQPVAYASRVLNRHERKYPSVELEALGVVFALETFRVYLQGDKTSTVLTDKSALTTLLQQKNLKGRLAKYQLAVQAYNIKIEHRSGRTNVFCDYVSRRVSAAVTAEREEVDKLILQPITTEEIRREQKKKRFCVLLYDALVEK